MDHDLKAFLTWVDEERRKKGPRRVRYPKQRQTWAAEYARRRVAAGSSFRDVLKELTVSEPSLRKWLAARTPYREMPSRFRAVQLKDIAAPTLVPGEPGRLTVITPRGFRIEGLDEARVVALVRELG